MQWEDSCCWAQSGVPKPTLIYLSGAILGVATGMFMTTNWAMGTNLVPPEEAGRYLGISNLAGAGAGIHWVRHWRTGSRLPQQITPGVGYFAIFAAYGVLFLLSTVSLRFIREPKPSISAANCGTTRMIVFLWLLLILLILLILAIGLALSFYFTRRAQLGEVHSPRRIWAGIRSHRAQNQ